MRGYPMFGFPGGKNFLVYYTSTSWLAGEEEFAFFADGVAEYGLWACNPATGKYRKLHALERWRELVADLREEEFLSSVLLPRQNALLLPRGSELWRLDLSGGGEEKLAAFDEGMKLRGPLAASGDETVLCGGLYSAQFNASRVAQGIDCSPVLVCDTVSGGILSRVTIPFHANHFQFFPGGDRILFAHEGATETVPDRLNVLDWREGKWECAYRQESGEAEGLLEYVGHEMVAGEKIAAVRYPVSRTDEFGLLLVDPRSKTGGLIDADDYWHCAADTAGEKFVMDTMWWGRARRREEHVSDIVLFDPLAARKEVIAVVDSGLYSQAYHPHPRFSPSGRKVLFAAQPGKDTKELLIGLRTID